MLISHPARWFSCVRFAGPRIGNRPFRNLLKHLDMPVLNVVNFGDIIPCLPAGILPLPTGWIDAKKGVLRATWDFIRNLPGNLSKRRPPLPHLEVHAVGHMLSSGFVFYDRTVLVHHGWNALRCPPRYWRECVWYNKWMPALWSYVNTGEFLFVDSDADRSRQYIDRHALPNAT